MRKTLTAQEVSYWKKSLSKILKVGAEFEFNLPEKQGGLCKGTNLNCPCKHFGKEDRDCWKDCLNTNACKDTPSRLRCANFKSECAKKDCNVCEDYEFKCVGITCSNYMSPCLNCTDFEMDCHNCKYRFDPMKDPEHIKSLCSKILNPSKSYGVVNPSGVHNIVTDGSLKGNGGMEIITTGRRLDYWEFYEMAKSIINTATENGGYVNERCSIHMHCLASYYGKLSSKPFTPDSAGELEKSVPEIVLANIHQLLRRYQNAITWMTSGLDDPDHLTRWEKFRVSILPISAVTQTMPNVISSVIDNSGGNKYSFANYKFCKFDGNGDVSRLHIELRVMDALMSPSAVTAMMCLYQALFIKAVEISRYGIMQVGDKEWYKQAKEVKNALLNNRSSWQEGDQNGRVSNTKNLHKYTDILVKESFELINQLKHILFASGPAYETLEKMAESPCSIRRCGGDSWEKIENDLKIEIAKEDKLDYHIQRIIDTREILGSNTISSWINSASSALFNSGEFGNEIGSLDDMICRVTDLIEEKRSDGDLIWAKKIGSVIAI